MPGGAHNTVHRDICRCLSRVTIPLYHQCLFLPEDPHGQERLTVPPDPQVKHASVSTWCTPGCRGQLGHVPEALQTCVGNPGLQTFSFLLSISRYAAVGASARLFGTPQLSPEEDSEDRPREHGFSVTVWSPVKAALLQDASVM